MKGPIKKKVFRQSRQAVKRMEEARKAASSREISDAEFVRQSPVEVQVQRNQQVRGDARRAIKPGPRPWDVAQKACRSYQVRT